jgi:protein-disulfide isomerase
METKQILLVGVALIIGIVVGYLIPHGQSQTAAIWENNALTSKINELAQALSVNLETQDVHGKIYLLGGEGQTTAICVGNKTVVIGMNTTPKKLEELINQTLEQMKQMKELRPVNIKFDQGNLTEGNGTVVLLEFSDFDCPGCEAFYQMSHEKVEELVKKGLLTHAYRSFPLDYHANAMKTALAARCAAEQGKFWEYYNKLFANRREWITDPDKYLVQYAKDLGLNETQFKECLNSQKYLEEVNKDKQDAQLYGSQGTPSLFFLTKNKEGAQQVLNKYAGQLNIVGYQTPDGYVIYVFGGIPPNVLEDIVTTLHG